MKLNLILTLNFSLSAPQQRSVLITLVTVTVRRASSPRTGIPRVLLHIDLSLKLLSLLQFAVHICTGQFHYSCGSYLWAGDSVEICERRLTNDVLRSWSDPRRHCPTLRCFALSSSSGSLPASSSHAPSDMSLCKEGFRLQGIWLGVRTSPVPSRTCRGA